MYRKVLLVTMLLLQFVWAGARQNLDEKIALAESKGKLLYRLERASWMGTDIILEKSKETSNFGGYFSYVIATQTVFLFYSKGEQPKVLATVTFDSAITIKTAQVELKERALSEMEFSIYKIRMAAAIELNKGDFFKVYENTSLNLIPIVDGDHKEVYILTGPQKNGVVVFGNDYYLKFDEEYRLIERKKLHHDVFFCEYGAATDTAKTPKAFIHTHLAESGDIMSPTDICTALLYEQIAGWESIHVISNQYFSTWSCSSDKLVVLPKKVMEKILKNERLKNK